MAEDYARWFGARLRAVTAAIGSREWLCGDRFTMADVSVGYALHFADLLALSARFAPELRAYLVRLEARPAFLRAKEAQTRAGAEQGVEATDFRRLVAASA